MDVLDVGGRAVEWCADGPQDGVVVVFFHGTPAGMRLEGAAGDALVAAGVRLVGFSRPGNGHSDRLQRRRVVDVVDDVRAVLKLLGVEEFRALGWSGGGPHALAAAARIPGCVRVVNVAGCAPMQGFDWADGMVESNVVEFRTAMEGEEALRQMIDPTAPVLAAMSGESMLDGLADVLSPADVASLRCGSEAETLAAGIRSALENSNDGYIDDELALVAPWGFDLDEVHVPVTIWHGEQDRMC